MSTSSSPTDTPTHVGKEEETMKAAFVDKESSPKRYTEEISRWAG